MGQPRHAAFVLPIAIRDRPTTERRQSPVTERSQSPTTERSHPGLGRKPRPGLDARTSGSASAGFSPGGGGYARGRSKFVPTCRKNIDGRHPVDRMVDRKPSSRRPCRDASPGRCRPVGPPSTGHEGDPPSGPRCPFASGYTRSHDTPGLDGMALGIPARPSRDGRAGLGGGGPVRSVGVGPPRFHPAGPPLDDPPRRGDRATSAEAELAGRSLVPDRRGRRLGGRGGLGRDLDDRRPPGTGSLSPLHPAESPS
jgi:hypothetical protein